MKPNFRKFFRSPTAALVAAFLILTLLAFCSTAKAEEMRLELGGTLVNVENGAVLWLDSRYDVGPGDSRLSIGAFLISESQLIRDGRQISTQAGISAQLVDRLGPLELGLGVAYQQQDKYVVSTPLRFSLSAGLRFENRRHLLPDALTWRHLSNAGSGYPNSGWDMITVAWFVN